MVLKEGKSFLYPVPSVRNGFWLFWEIPLNRTLLWEIPYNAHEILVRTQTTGPQAYSRKEFKDQTWEVLSTHEAVNWIPTPGPLARISTKCHIHPLLLPIVSQCNAHWPPSRIQKTPNQGFWRSEVNVLRLRIRFVRQDLACGHCGGFGSCLFTWVCCFNDSLKLYKNTVTFLRIDDSSESGLKYLHITPTLTYVYSL